MEGFANNFGEVKLTSEYLAARTALQELPEKEAEICCLQILGPLRQERFANQYGVTPTRGHLITLLRSAKRRGYSVPWVPNRHALVRFLKGRVLAGGAADRLRAEVRRRLEAECKIDPQRLRAIKAKIAELDGDLQSGAQRVLRASDEIVDLLTAELTKLRRERERLAGELQELELREPCDVEAEATAAAERLAGYAKELEGAKPARLRELLNRMVSVSSYSSIPNKEGRVSSGPFLRALSTYVPSLCLQTCQLRGQDLNLRPRGYEPRELPDCSTPRC